MISESLCDTEDWSNDAETEKQKAVLNNKTISQYYILLHNRLQRHFRKRRARL